MDSSLKCPKLNKTRDMDSSLKCPTLETNTFVMWTRFWGSTDSTLKWYTQEKNQAVKMDCSLKWPTSENNVLGVGSSLKWPTLVKRSSVLKVEHSLKMAHEDY